MTESGAANSDGASITTGVLPPPPGGWVAPERQPPGPPKPLRASWLAAAALGAIGTDIALRRPPWNNLAAALLFLALATALWMTGVVHTRSGKGLLCLASFFALCLVWRSDPLLGAFNFFASAGLLALAGYHGSGRSLWRWTPVQAFADIVHAMRQAAITTFDEIPTEVGAWVHHFRASRRAPSNGSTRAVARGVALALPIVVVLGLLLASADAVFGAIFSNLGLTNLGFNGWPLVGHLVLLGFGAIGTLAMLRIASTVPDEEEPVQLFTIGSIEWTIVLVGINVLFSIFAFAQILTIAGGADNALERAGVDPKEFARQGFFQLLWVAAITVVVLMAVHASRDVADGQQRRFRLLAGVTVVLTAMIVVVALARLGFYIEDQGQTPLRFYSSVVSVWIAICLALVLARILGWRAEGKWLTSAILLSALVIGVVLNVANPEAIMANDNLDKNKTDLVFHLKREHRQFTGDGWAVIADGLPRLSSEIAAGTRAELCREFQNTSYNDGILHFNFGKWRGHNALTDICVSAS